MLCMLQVTYTASFPFNKLSVLHLISAGEDCTKKKSLGVGGRKVSIKGTDLELNC